MDEEKMYNNINMQILLPNMLSNIRYDKTSNFIF